MKRNAKGFTLIELLLVLLLLAILAGIAIPSFIAYIDSADERSCSSTIRMLEQAAVAEEKITPTLKESVKLDPNSLFKLIEHGEERRTTSCPCGGTYSAKYDYDNDKIVIVCSYHSDEEVISGYQEVINKIKDDYMKTHNYMNGQTLNNMLKEQYGGSLPTTEIGGAKYYIKGNTAPGFSQPILYLSVNSSSSSWNCEYIYIADTGKWYKSANTNWNGTVHQEINIASKGAFDTAIANGKLVPTNDIL